MASVELESLTGPEAVQKAVTETLQQAAGQQMKTTVVQLEVSPGGITVTDIKRKCEQHLRFLYDNSALFFCF
jgi:hypothetical protein